MGLLQTFTALYSTFYDSKDSKAYLPLPLKPSEVFLAKTLSGSMVGMTFMVPILSLLILAYWQFIGPLGIVVGLLSFIVSLFINLVFSVILSNSIGTPDCSQFSSKALFDYFDDPVNPIDYVPYHDG